MKNVLTELDVSSSESPALGRLPHLNWGEAARRSPLEVGPVSPRQSVLDLRR